MLTKWLSRNFKRLIRLLYSLYYEFRLLLNIYNFNVYMIFKNGLFSSGSVNWSLALSCNTITIFHYSRLFYHPSFFSHEIATYIRFNFNVFSCTSSHPRYAMPWDNLPQPDSNCFRKYCRDNRDCCRRFSKCNKRAHVCYDCWYGHPCRSHFDCCAQYPYCNPVLNTCGK